METLLSCFCITHEPDLPEFLEIIISEYQLIPKGPLAKKHFIEWMSRHFGDAVKAFEQTKVISELELFKKQNGSILFHITYQKEFDTRNHCCNIVVQRLEKVSSATKIIRDPDNDSNFYEALVFL